MHEHYQGASPISCQLLLEWWKPVVGFENRYEVSNVGNICRLGKARGFTPYRHLKVNVHKQWGRRYINTFDGTKRRSRKIHQIMVDAFLGGTPPGMTINHIDGKKQNDRLSNFEFLTLGDNIRHAHRMGIFASGEQSWNAKVTPEKVREIRLLVAKMSYAELGRRYGVSESNIRKIAKREIWGHVK